MLSTARVRHLSTKTYTHSVGLSCCFRQWKAESHCRFLHGYALQIKLVFSGNLDERNWVVDFGGLKPVRQWLEDTFDHKMLVANDDPLRAYLIGLGKDPDALAQVVMVDNVGCEAFAELIFRKTDEYLINIYNPRHKSSAQIEIVEVSEHPGNSALCQRASS